MDQFEQEDDFRRVPTASTSALLPDVKLVVVEADQAAEGPDYSNHPHYFDASSLQCTVYDEVLRNKGSLIPLIVSQGAGQ